MLPASPSATRDACASLSAQSYCSARCVVGAATVDRARRKIQLCRVRLTQAIRKTALKDGARRLNDNCRHQTTRQLRVRLLFLVSLPQPPGCCLRPRSALRENITSRETPGEVPRCPERRTGPPERAEPLGEPCQPSHALSAGLDVRAHGRRGSSMRGGVAALLDRRRVHARVISRSDKATRVVVVGRRRHLDRHVIGPRHRCCWSMDEERCVDTLCG